MKKYIIRWDAGFGESYEVIEAGNEDEAVDWAYENWKEEAEGNAKYSADEYSEELAVELGLEDEDEE